MAIVIGIICAGMFSLTGYWAWTCEGSCPRQGYEYVDPDPYSINRPVIDVGAPPVNTSPNYYVRPDASKF